MQLLNEEATVVEVPKLPQVWDAARAESPERLLVQAQTAVHNLDIAECTHITEWAYRNPHTAAGPALCTLLRRPRTLKGKQVWRRDAWVEMRIAAIRALAVNKDQLAAPTLAHVLMYDVPVVREEARIAMQALGSNAVLSLVDTIRVSTDWPASGMLNSIETLGLIRDKNAGPTLARILFGLLPNVPGRWMRLQLKWSAILGAIGTACVGGFAFYDSPEGVPYLMAAISGIFMFLTFTGLSAVGVGVFIRTGKKNEANRVNAAAADALISIKDPRSVPSLIEVATEKYSNSARAGAILALRETLPVLNSSDFGLLTGAVESRLTGMFALNNPTLILEAVRALEFVGTGQSEGPVARLAKRRVQSNSAIHAQIQTEAERVLPVLTERKRSAEASKVLLRPSQIASDSGFALLRPASSLSAYEDPVDQLLRPGSAE